MQTPHRPGLSRRRLLGTAAAIGAGVAVPTAVPHPAAATSGSTRPPDSPLPIPEPYPPLHGGRLLAGRIHASPDPLVRYRWPTVRSDDGLQVYPLRPRHVVAEAADAFTNVRSATTGRCDVEVLGTGSLRFDFGVESPAWLEFDSPDLFGDVELSISEYNRPGQVNPGPQHPVKTLTPERVGDTFRLKLNAAYYEGVRFGWIHVRTFDRPWHITGVRLVCQAKPANYLGSFHSNDERLNRIWYAGAYSARVGFQQDHFGAILMDRGDRHSWSGDCYPHQAASLAVFGNDDFVRDNLKRTASISNGIEIYSLYWVLSLLDYYQYTGDVDLLSHFAANAQGKLGHANTLFDDPVNGFYGWDERLGAGFEAPNNEETKKVFQATFVQCCRRYADALDTIGDDTTAATYRAIAQARVSQLRHSPDWHRSWGLHALTEAINAGFVEQTEQQEIFALEFADRLNRLSFSPFNQYFVLHALAKLGRTDEALVTVDDNWGGQLDYGGTTFFEVFRPDWVRMLGTNDPVPNSQSGWTSLAHPWGAGVTAWLSHEILGVRPTSPGFSTFDVAPRPGRTLELVSGTVPTPRGEVEVRFDLRNGRGSVTVPPGTTARIVIPEDGRRIETVRISRRGGILGSASRRPAPADEWTAQGQVLYDVPPGTWDIHVQYVGTRSPYRCEPIRYPMRFLPQDRSTSGDWGGNYGRDGYLLFSYESPGTHRQALPPYIRAVTPLRGTTWSNSRDTQWEVGTDDRRALAPDPTNATPRTAGVVYSETPSAGGMTMVVDIDAEPGRRHRTGLYFVDWDSTARRVAVEVFDLATRKVVAPVVLVDDFHDGAYLVFECDRAVRGRIAHVLGPNAVLSGVFFDPV